ncbi:MAG: deoxyribose-phosphate aldolase [Cyanobacteriota bacterium ELA615]
MTSEIDLASYIEHALLDITTTKEQIRQACAEAEHFRFAAVCLYPCHVKYAAQLLHNKKTSLCAVVGFPTGMSTAQTKLYEASEAVENGANELDLMPNLGLLKQGDLDSFYTEIAQITQEVDKPVKVILEMALLNPNEKQTATEIALQAGASYLKTSTGFFGGATVEDVQLLLSLTKGRVGIKASGGIRTTEQALALIRAGANRLGTSKGAELVSRMQSEHT